LNKQFGSTILSAAFVAILLLSGMLAVYRIPLVASQETLLHSHRIEGELPITDPISGVWWNAIPLQVPLSAQTTVAPMLLEPSIRAVTVRSLNNGSWIVFLLEWSDSTNNTSAVRTEDFTDGAAIQIPQSGESPPYVCMGQQDTAVNIWHWKGDWQADIDFVFRDAEQTYPNFWVDLYPYAVGGPPYTIPGSFPSQVRNLTLVGWAAGNPFSDPFRLSPIEDLIAGGFGTLTWEPHQNVVGRGVWKNGQWHVVFARPLQTGDPNDIRLYAGEQRSVAFAVWDGANREVDGKKAISAWLTLTIDRTGPPLVPFHLVNPIQAGAVLVLVLVIAMIAFAHKPTREERTAH